MRSLGARTSTAHVRRGRDVLSEARHAGEMRVVAREPGVDPQFTREFPCSVDRVLVTSDPSVVSASDDADRQKVCACASFGSEHIACLRDWAQCRGQRSVCRRRLSKSEGAARGGHSNGPFNVTRASPRSMASCTPVGGARARHPQGGAPSRRRRRSFKLKTNSSF